MSDSPYIPNFRQFAITRYAGGVPTGKGWQEILTLGIQDVWKFDEPEESSDAIAIGLGMRIHFHPISVLQQILVGPGDLDFRSAIMEMHDCPGSIFVHCGSVARTAQWLLDRDDSKAGGNDRSGLAFGCYLLWYGGLSKDAIFALMLKYGFHRILLGLWRYWKRV